MFKYFERMTTDQQKIASEFEESLMQEVTFCISKLTEIDKIGIKGHVSLPAISATGKPVLHGANVEIYHIRFYYCERLRLAARHLSFDLRDNIPNRYI